MQRRLCGEVGLCGETHTRGRTKKTRCGSASRRQTTAEGRERETAQGGVGGGEGGGGGGEGEGVGGGGGGDCQEPFFYF